MKATKTFKASQMPLFIVDPYLVSPDKEACSFLQDAMHSIEPSRVYFFEPAKDGIEPLQSALKSQLPKAVVCLGSFANLTENRPWMRELGNCLSSQVINAHVPLLGICFTHQLLAESSKEWSVGPVPIGRLPLGQKWNGPRLVTATHPKLRLLFLPFNPGERGSSSARDLAFQWCVLETRLWNATRWKTVFTDHPARLSSAEKRVRQFVESHCPNEIVSVASHEQEVRECQTHVPSENRTLVPAAQSNECTFEAFVHETECVFTFQTHPERSPTSQAVMSNFLYLAHIIAAFQRNTHT